MRIDVGGWEVGGRLPRGPDADEARVRLVSAATQTRRKFALEMGRPGHKTDQMGPGRRALGRLVCPFYPKRTGPDKMRSRGEVGLRPAFYLPSDSKAKGVGRWWGVMRILCS